MSSARPELWALLALSGTIAAFPDYFMRFRNGEPFINDTAQPGIARLARVCAGAIFLIALYFLWSGR